MPASHHFVSRFARFAGHHRLYLFAITRRQKKHHVNIVTDVARREVVERQTGNIGQLILIGDPKFWSKVLHQMINDQLLVVVMN